MTVRNYRTLSGKNLKWLPLFFIVFSVLLRFFSMFQSVIDHDESTYAVMGMEMLRSKLLYLDLLDIKPVGIYLLFSGITFLIKSIFFIRLIGAIFVGLSAYQLYKIKSYFTKNENLKIIVGLTFIVLCSLDPLFKSEPFGLSSNTELFYTFFTLLSINILLSARLKLATSFFAGLILGLGVIIKYIVIVEACGIFVFFLLHYGLSKDIKGIKQTLFSGILYLLGALIPFGLSHLYYLGIGEYEAIRYVTFEATTRYQSSFNLEKQFSFIMGNHQMLITMILFYLSLLGKYVDNGSNKREKLFALIWFFFAVIAISSTGNPYNHYRIQLFGSMAFVIPNIAFRTKWISAFIKEKTLIYLAYSIITLNLFFYSFWYYNKYFARSDENRSIATYINAKKQPNDLLYNRSHRRQIVHLLTGLSSATRIIHSNNFGDPKREYVFNINRKNECRTIYDRKPRFILGYDEVCLEHSNRFKNEYELDTLISGTELYIRKKEDHTNSVVY